jgi:hypothetical protein
MDQEQERQAMPTDEQKRESGLPGGGAGRRDEVGRSGVFPASSAEGASPEAEFRAEPAWGQGERGAAGYEDSGSSELNFSEEIAAEGVMEPPDLHEPEEL